MLLLRYLIQPRKYNDLVDYGLNFKALVVSDKTSMEMVQQWSCQ